MLSGATKTPPMLRWAGVCFPDSQAGRLTGCLQILIVISLTHLLQAIIELGTLGPLREGL